MTRSDRQAARKEAADQRERIGDELERQNELLEAVATELGADLDAEDSAEDAESFDEAAWLDDGYETRAERVRSGDVDDHLDEIEDAETSSTVEDAVAERRAELEE